MDQNAYHICGARFQHKFYGYASHRQRSCAKGLFLTRGTGRTQVWTVSLPVVVLNSPGVSDLALGGSNPGFGTARDVVGIVLWALGLAIETVSDAQKARGHPFSSVVGK